MFKINNTISGCIKTCTIVKPKWFRYTNCSRGDRNDVRGMPEDSEDSFTDAILRKSEAPVKRFKRYGGRVKRHETYKLKEKNSFTDDFHDME